MNSPKYFPPKKGKYEVTPGLSALEKDFGNGSIDRKIFQLDDDFARYHLEKTKSREESLEKYYRMHSSLGISAIATICQYIMATLILEYPENFDLDTTPDKRIFSCKLTGERIAIAADATIIDSESKLRFQYKDLFDALAMQIQEDLAIWNIGSDANCLGAVHLSFPNHWSPNDKIGKDFKEVHHPVASFEKMHPATPNLLKSMRDKGPFTRFAWGLATDTKLNHHPQPRKGISPEDWHGRKFSPENPKLYMRVERQTLSPFTKEKLCLFTIRTYFYDVASLASDEIEQLELAITSMTNAESLYKGLEHSKNEIVDYLQSLKN